MRTFISRLFISQLSGFVSILILLFSTTTQAQTSGRNEGWYQVEMIVFARRNAATDEHFPKSIKLRYPSRWVDLKDPNKPEMTTPVDDANSIQSSSISSIDLTTEAWWQLPASDRKLNDQARILERNPNYEVLFHQAWRQQVTNARQATSILINGGKVYGKHQELEGSINLSVATYLKITTNLWFTQFDVATDTLATDTLATEPATQSWPELPLRPNYIASMTPAETTPTESNAENPMLTSSITEEEKEPYTPRLIALMRQERDMRSNEVHYLDHPLLGIVIKIIPYRP